MIDAARRSLDVSRAMHQERQTHQTACERFAALTPRELELLKLVAGGQSNKQIAKEMGISVKTVANHRASLMAKTGAANAADVVRLFTIARAPAARPAGQSS